MPFGLAAMPTPVLPKRKSLRQQPAATICRALPTPTVAAAKAIVLPQTASQPSKRRRIEAGATVTVTGSVHGLTDTVEQQPAVRAFSTAVKAQATASTAGVVSSVALTAAGRKTAKRQRTKTAAAAAAVVEAPSVLPAGATAPSGKKPASRRKAKAAQPAAEEPADAPATPAAKKARRSRKAAGTAVASVQSVAVEVDEVLVDGEVWAAPKPKRARKKHTGPVYELPDRSILQTVESMQRDPLPVPNLGYCCLNMALREQKPPIFTNRDMIQKTFKEKGLPYVSQLALQNVQELKGIIKWNAEHGIRLFRMTSNFFPWCTFYRLEELPEWAQIEDELQFVGKLARAYGQRLTFHPSHFVKLAAEKEDLLQRSIDELEVHSKILDVMGYPPSHYNKINIHIGGVYKDKETTLKRFAEGFSRLSNNCKKRLTVENDDWPSAFSVRDLLPFSQQCSVPIVFDWHHHRFCSGDWSAEQAFLAAIETWPLGVRPIVHWSESQEGRKPHAHSDYISGPMNLCGHAADVDVMIEAKCKERTLLRFRDETLPGQRSTLDHVPVEGAMPNLNAAPAVVADI